MGEWPKAVDGVCKGAPMTPPATDREPPADLTFACPRCGDDVSDRFYGPCGICRHALRLAYEGQARDVEIEDYVPKMNVTPNAVATKD